MPETPPPQTDNSPREGDDILSPDDLDAIMEAAR